MAVQPDHGNKKITRKHAASPGSADAAPVSGKPTLAKIARRNADIGRTPATLTAESSVKISVRVDPGVFAAVATELGLPETDLSAVVNASLAIALRPTGSRDGCETALERSRTISNRQSSAAWRRQLST